MYDNIIILSFISISIYIMNRTLVGKFTRKETISLLLKKISKDQNRRQNHRKETKLLKKILKDHKNIIRHIKKIRKDKIKLENRNKNIKLADEQIKLKCIAQTSHYKRCKQSVKYIHLMLNKSGENNKKKKNAPFCTRHMNLLLSSTDKKSLKYGYYFENDSLT